MTKGAGMTKEAGMTKGGGDDEGRGGDGERILKVVFPTSQCCENFNVVGGRAAKVFFGGL